jgi:hypothetical protein
MIAAFLSSRAQRENRSAPVQRQKKKGFLAPLGMTEFSERRWERSTMGHAQTDE